MAEAAPIKQLPTSVYDKMTFPDYEYSEFPIAVPYVNGRVMPTPYDDKHKSHPVVIVNSQAELDALKGGEVEIVLANSAVFEGPSRVKTEEDEREELIFRAGQLKLKVDPKWSVDRIEKAIKEAEAV